ncbi:MAG TPA: Flp family type IVb pilin [Ktedonobacterales bacterium]|jgi:Flp pilus assembly pilin Flp|nr:Flp family type IVb pilin [Ktedonobacterales bacterium]
MRFNQTLPGIIYAHALESDAQAPGPSLRSRGQALVEYALIIVLVAIVVAFALSLLAPTINSIFRSLPPAL